MRGPFTPQTVALLARSAGFDFAPERCKLLAPQLEWLLEQGELLATLRLMAEEPALVYRPDSAVSLAKKEAEHG